MKKSKNFALFIKRKYIVMFFISLMSNGFVYISELLDSILGGWFIGEDAVSAISLVQPFYMLILFVGGLISAGTDTLYSRAAGNFDQKKANAIFGQSLTVTLALSIMITTIFVLFKQPLLNLYAEGNSQKIMDLASDYYDYYCLVAFFYPIQWLTFSIVFTDGGAKLTIAGDIATLVVNFVVSIIAVQYMGIKGLGLGTFCGLVASILVMSIHFFTKASSVGLGFQFKIKEIIETIALGLSSSTSMLMGAIVDLVMNIYIIKVLGCKFLPAYSIANMILNLTLIFSHAGTASSPLNSGYFGENNPDGNKKTMGVVTKYTMIEAIIFTVVIEAASGILPSLYNITDPEVFSSSVLAVRILGLTFVPTCLLLIYMMYYSTVGHNGLSMLLLTSYMLVSPLALCPTFGMLFGMNGIFVALALTPIVSDLICIIVILIKYGRKKLPLILKDTNASIKSWDIKISKENNIQLCNDVCNVLTETYKIDKLTVARVRLALEETYMLILENNSNKKVYSECTLFVENENIELIIRDNGIINNLSQEENKKISLRDYVYHSMNGIYFKNSYLKTTSYNRYKYSFSNN